MEANYFTIFLKIIFWPTTSGGCSSTGTLHKKKKKSSLSLKKQCSDTQIIVTLPITAMCISLIFPINLQLFRLRVSVIFICHHMALPSSPPFIMLLTLLWTFSCYILPLIHHQQKVIPNILGIRYSSTYIVALKSVLQLWSNISLTGLLGANIQKLSFHWDKSKSCGC